MKKEAADSIINVLNLIWNSVYACAWKCGRRKSEEWLENHAQSSVCLSL